MARNMYDSLDSPDRQQVRQAIRGAGQSARDVLFPVGSEGRSWWDLAEGAALAWAMPRVGTAIGAASDLWPGAAIAGQGALSATALGTAGLGGYLLQDHIFRGLEDWMVPDRSIHDHPGYPQGELARFHGMEPPKLDAAAQANFQLMKEKLKAELSDQKRDGQKKGDRNPKLKGSASGQDSSNRLSGKKQTRKQRAKARKESKNRKGSTASSRSSSRSSSSTTSSRGRSKTRSRGPIDLGPVRRRKKRKKRRYA